MPKRKGIQSTEDLREDLECPVCLAIPKSGHIYQCDSGHIHCEKCHSGLRECPVCRGRIGNTRNLMLEKIVAKLPTKCAFTEYGCLTDENVPKDMILHEKSCNFRLVKCIERGCNENVPLADFMDHFRLKHDNSQDANGTKKTRIFNSNPLDLQQVLTEQHIIGTTEINFGACFLKSTNHFFVLRLKREEKGYFCLYVSIIGSQKQIKDEEYKCKIKIGSNTVNFQGGISHDGFINVIDDSELVPSVTLHPRQMKTFFNNGSFMYSVTVSSASDIDVNQLKCHDDTSTDFINACYLGNEVKVDRILKDNPGIKNKINLPAECGMNGFMIACHKGFTEIVSLFLKKASEFELNVNLKDQKKGHSGLTMAILRDHLEIVKLLTQNKAINIDLNQTVGPFSTTPFMYACKKGSKDMVAYFLKLAQLKKKEAFDLNAVRTDGITAFHFACFYKQEDAVDLILGCADKLKIDLELKNNEGKTGYDLWPEKFEDVDNSRASKRPRIEAPSTSA